MDIAFIFNLDIHRRIGMSGGQFTNMLLREIAHAAYPRPCRSITACSYRGVSATGGVGAGSARCSMNHCGIWLILAFPARSQPTAAWKLRTSTSSHSALIEFIADCRFPFERFYRIFCGRR
jgi:hypothetical protein